MSNRKFEKKLQEMKGKTFEYAKQIHCLQDYSIDEDNEKVVIKTNLNSFTRKFESVEEFLGYWKPHLQVQVSTPATPTEESNNAVSVFIESEKSKADALIAVLEDNIKKVQENKDYIPQASAINKNVSSIINIQKMKIDMVKNLKRK
ncbi:MAG TPA: hypothetical protein VMZ03_04065 [Chitinophagaceae bacterium]|nr:hypothetical protein [Chitinophagaceae bacterium]